MLDKINILKIILIILSKMTKRVVTHPLLIGLINYLISQPKAPHAISPLKSVLS